MRKSPMFLVSLFALALSATSLSAQSSSAPSAARKGFFIGGGFGAGSAGLDCDGCNVSRQNGLSGNFHIGGTINPHLRLGFESNGWVHSENGVDSQIGFWTGAAYLYPSMSNNLWLKGGVGLATAKASDNTDELKADGLGVSVGIGYDWAVSGGNFVVVPFAGYLRQLSGKGKYDGVDTGVSANANLFQFGVGIGYRH
jgi:hypothetical protein